LRVINTTVTLCTAQVTDVQRDVEIINILTSARDATINQL